MFISILLCFSLFYSLFKNFSKKYMNSIKRHFIHHSGMQKFHEPFSQGAVAQSKTYTGYRIKEPCKPAISCIVFLNAAVPQESVNDDRSASSPSRRLLASGIFYKKRLHFIPINFMILSGCAGFRHS